MTSRHDDSPEEIPPVEKRRLLFSSALLVLATLLAYSDSFSGPFIFDDVMAVTRNPSIHHLWPLERVLVPPGNLPVGGRPILNLSFALNYMMSGKEVWSYHVFNLVIHLLAGLTLFGVVRRTLRQPILRTRFGTDSTMLAFGVALLWMVHPLQTESVTYISQRAESIMGLFYLLTLYCFIRSAEARSNQTFWSILGVTACLLGMGTKEVMVTAPLMVFIYDRTFMAGSFHEAWARRGSLHRALMATWLLLGYLLLDIGKRGVGFGVVTPWSCAFTEAQGMVRYLKLTLVPYPLVLDYGTDVVKHPLKVLPQIIVVALLLAATGWAFVRRPALGFAGVWFFGILALTSTLIAVAGQPLAQHRLYLSLAAVMMLLVLGLYLLLGRRAGYVIGGLALVYGVMTYQRNLDYVTAVSIWKVTLQTMPENIRAKEAYGYALLDAKQYPEAMAEIHELLRLHPDEAEAYYNLGLTLLRTGHPEEAIANYRKAIHYKPDFADAYYNLGKVLFQRGQLPEAVDQFKLDLVYNPEDADAEVYLGSARARAGHPEEAIPYFQSALEKNPDSLEAHNNWGIALEMLGRKGEAADQFREALKLDPNYTQARENLSALEPPSNPTSGP